MDAHVDSLELSAEPASVPAARRFVRAALTEVVAAEVAADLQLVVSELVTNAVQYGTESPIAVAVGYDPGAAFVAVTNTSAVTSAVGPVSTWNISDVRQLDGRGLGIVRAIADDVSVERSDRQLTIKAVRVTDH